MIEMDLPVEICSFLFHSNFIHFLEICQLFNFDVTDLIFLGYECIVFFDSLDFVIFLGLVANENYIEWSFL